MINHHYWIAIFQDSLWGNAIYVKEANSISVELRKNVSNCGYFLNRWIKVPWSDYKWRERSCTSTVSTVWRPNNKVCKSTSWLSSPAYIKHNSQFHAALLHNFLLQFLFWKSWSYFHWFDYCPIQATQLLAKFTVMIFVFNYTGVMTISLTLYVRNDRLSFSLYYWLTLLTRRCLPIWMMMSVYLIKL